MVTWKQENHHVLKCHSDHQYTVERWKKHGHSERVRKLHYWSIQINSELERLFEHTVKRKYYMASKSKSKKTSINWNTVTVRLSGKEKAEAKKWCEAQVWDMEKFQAEPSLDGYKVSQSYSEAQDMWYVSYTGKDWHEDNPESTLTSQSKNLLIAYMINYWKHYVFFNGGTWKNVDNADEELFD